MYNGKKMIKRVSCLLMEDLTIQSLSTDTFLSRAEALLTSKVAAISHLHVAINVSLTLKIGPSEFSAGL